MDSNPEHLAEQIRRVVLDRSFAAGVGHIGSSLSVADIVATLFAGVLRGEPADSDRDRFVLSKGHAALALYAALFELGHIDATELNAFCSDGTTLGTHPEHVVRGIDFSTGSLGHGLSIGAGAALAARLQGSGRRVYVLVSDAECNEGALWEAVMFAAHHRLDNLVAVVDANGSQALGRTRDVLDLDPLAARWSAFGWDVHETDGHDTHALVSALQSVDAPMPHAVIAHTVLGKGVSFMEGEVDWHYLPMSEMQYRRASTEISA